MRTKTGVMGMCLMALGALVASSANTKTAEAHSNTSQPMTAFAVARAATSATIESEIPASIMAPQPISAPETIAVEIITPPPADPYLENPTQRRMQPREISPGMLAVAAKIVHKYHAKPVGTQIEVEVEGKRVIARIERHFHPEGGPVKPWGFHPGVSLFAHR